MKKITIPILAAAGLAALSACAGAVTPRPAAAIRTLVAAGTPPSSSAAGPTVTVVGSGTAAGTPDQASMSFGVESNAGSAASALGGESSAARRLIAALKSAGIADPDIQTQWVSLYYDSQNHQFDASSAVSARIRDLSRAGAIIDSAVAAAGDSIRLNGISLSIGDTSALMSDARKQAVGDAAAKAQEYAQAAGLKLGPVVSISEASSAPQPVYYGLAQPQAAAAQPIEPGQQTLEVSVTVVYSLVQ
jgi:uncharacterized protein YggE